MQEVNRSLVYSIEYHRPFGIHAALGLTAEQIYELNRQHGAKDIKVYCDGELVIDTRIHNGTKITEFIKYLKTRPSKQEVLDYYNNILLTLNNTVTNEIKSNN